MDNLDYGVVGNCKTAALISKEGSIDWLCFPVFDSPSVFSKLLDNDKGGSFSFIVSDGYRITQNYFKETNILGTRFASNSLRQLRSALMSALTGSITGVIFWLSDNLSIISLSAKNSFCFPRKIG